MVDQLSKTEIAEYKTVFDQFDGDQNGRVTRDEFKGMLEYLGIKGVTDDQCTAMIKSVDKYGDMAMNFPEFLILMSKLGKAPCRQPTVDGIRETFDGFDKNGDGYITTAEMKQAMKDMGEQMTDAEIDQMIREADSDCDGKVNFEEFSKMMCAPQT